MLGGAERRRPLGLQVESLRGRQDNRKLVFGHGNLGAVFSVNNWDGGAPVALPRDQPVAQAEVGGRGAGSALLEHGNGARNGVGLSEAIERTGIHKLAVSGKRLARDGRVGGFDRPLC